MALTQEFVRTPSRQLQWEGFVRRNRLPAGGATLEQTQSAITDLIMPALVAARGR